MSRSSPASKYSANFPSALILHTLTFKLSGSCNVLLNNSNNAGIWLTDFPPGVLGATAIESRSMKMV